MRQFHEIELSQIHRENNACVNMMARLSSTAEVPSLWYVPVELADTPSITKMAMTVLSINKIVD